MCVDIGLSNDEYWKGTIRSHYFARKAREKAVEDEIILNRRLEYAIWASTLQPVTGKAAFPKLKKHSDLYKIQSDIEAEKRMVEEIKKNQIKKDQYLELLAKRGQKQ